MKGPDPQAPLDPARFSTLRRLATDPNNRLVVSLGGGALHGLCGNVALLHILEELELRPHVEEVWGTSAGAVIGGGWCTGTPALSILDRVRTLDRRGALDAPMFRFALRILASLWPLRRPMPDGFIRGDVFMQTIDSGLRVKTFEECDIPFRCIACSEEDLSRKVFRRGELLRPIFASMSLPGIVMPRPLDDGCTYYDGGLLEKSPLLSPIADHLKIRDPRRLLLLCTHFGNECTGPVKGFHNRFLVTLYALEGLAWDYQLREARSRDNVNLLLLDPRLGDAGMFDFSKTDEMYGQAHARFRDILQNAKLATALALG